MHERAVVTIAPTATDEQVAALTYLAGNAYVGAGPGTGKTFLLVERYRFLREQGIAGANILVLTFSRRGASELHRRLIAAGFAPNEIDVRTFHGFAARTIGGGAAGFKDRRLLDGFSRQIVLDTAIERTPTPALGAAVRASRAFRSEVETIVNDLARVSPEALAALEAQASPRLRDVFAIARWSVQARSSIGGSDIGDLVYRALREIGRAGSPAERWIDGRYAHVLVDEFQDTDRLQLELLAALHAIVFAVGDEAQSIYRFRGAANDVVAAASRRFAMRRFDLTVSRRCPPDVCALASQTPLPGLTRLHSARTERGAPIEIVRLRGVDDEAAFIADAVEAELNAGIPAAEIAVLLRAFRPVGPLLIDELQRRSIAVASTGREELLADPRIAALGAALDVLDRPDVPERWERFLASRSLRFDPLTVRFARSRLASLHIDESLATTLADVCIDGALTSADLAAALSHAAAAWAAGDIGTAARRLVRQLHLLTAVLNEEPPVSIRAAAGRLKLVCDALAGAQRTATALGSPARCTDVMGRFAEFLPGLALDDAGLDPSSVGVRILTIHAAKGLEFERVFVADAVAGRFPQDTRLSTLLTTADRALLASHGCDGPSIDPDGAALEEASLWYVALTRCKSRLTISFADHGLNGDPQQPSRFIPPDRLPGGVTAVDRESLDMRGLRSGDAAIREFVRTSDVLRKTPPMADYARDGPAAFAVLPGEPLRYARGFSVGDAELWLQCPRRLFYKKFVALTDDESASLALGSAIHEVLERFHAVHGVFDEQGIDVDRWTSDLLMLRRKYWAAQRFTSPMLSRAAEFAADVALQSYARVLGERARAQPFTVEARERNITVPAGRYALAGRVDRVDALAHGARVVIDYKLGRAPKKTTLAAAASILAGWHAADAAHVPRMPVAGRMADDVKLQLAFYATAIEATTGIAYVYLGGASEPEKRNGALFVSEDFGAELRAFAVAVLAEVETALLAPLAAGTLRSLAVAADSKTCTFCPYLSICPGARNA